MSETKDVYTVEDSPKEIWLEPQCCEAVTDRCWMLRGEDCPECGSPAVRYVRADLAYVWRKP